MLRCASEIYSANAELLPITTGILLVIEVQECSLYESQESALGPVAAGNEAPAVALWCVRYAPTSLF
jgi:hypothetical protein